MRATINTRGAWPVNCLEPQGCFGGASPTVVRRISMLAVVVAASLPVLASAQTVTWNGGNTTWTQPDSDSWTGATYSSGNTAVFAGSGTGTVTIDAGGVTPGQTNVTAGSYTFTGGGIGGSGGIAKSGAGTLTLSAANTYTGSTSVTAGVLNIQNATALGGTAAGAVVSNLAALQLQGGITVSGESLSINGRGISNDGALRNISGTNTWAGSLAVDLLGAVTNRVGSTTRIQSDAAGRLIISGPVSIAAGTFDGTAGTAAAVLLQGEGNGQISGNITGGTPGALAIARVASGVGTWTLSGSNSYLGFTGINTYEVIAAGGFAIPDTSLTYLMSSGRLTLQANETIGSLTSDSASSTVNLNGNTLSIGADNNSNPVDPNGQSAFQGSIIGTGGITKVGTGLLALTGSSSFSGASTLFAGTLRVSNAAALSTSSLAVNGGTLDLRSSLSVGTLSGTGGTISGGAAGSFTLTTTMNSNAAFSGSIANGSATAVSLTKAGSGILTLSGSTGNTFTGTTTVSAGQLALGKSSGNAVGGNLTITNALLTFSGNNQIADGAAVTMSGTSSVFNGTAWNTGVFALADAITSLTVTGGVFQQGGGGDLTVTGAASLTGGAGNTEFLSQSGGWVSFGSLALAGMTGTTLPANAAPNTFRLSGNTSARQTQVTIGSGGLSLDGSNILLAIGSNAGALGSRIVLNGDVTTLGSTASSIRPPTSGDGTNGTRAVALSDTVGAVTRSFTIGGGGADLNVLVPITNGSATTAGIRKLGAGILTLGTANTYTGATTISAGTLALGLNGSFASSPVITIGDAGSSGAVLDITAKTGTFAFASSQTVGGIGTLKMDAVDTARFAGTFAPGNSPGIFTVDGGTSLLSGTTQIEIFGTTRGTGYDAVDLVNAAALNYDNGVLALDFGSWLADQQSYQLFGSGSQSIGGTLSSLTLVGTNYTGLTFTGSNGVWTSQGTSPANQTLTFTEATGTLVIVPEPAGIALAVLGLATAALARRRK